MTCLVSRRSISTFEIFSGILFMPIFMIIIIDKLVSLLYPFLSYLHVTSDLKKYGEDNFLTHIQISSIFRSLPRVLKLDQFLWQSVLLTWQRD